MEDIEVEPIVKRKKVSSWENIGTSNIFENENNLLQLRVQKAKENNCTLRYVQRIEFFPPVAMGQPESLKFKPKASIKLEEVPLNSEYAMVKGAVYYFAFHTERYSSHPLVVQGPLSDYANTASGLLGDVLRIAKSVGAKDRGISSHKITKN